MKRISKTEIKEMRSQSKKNRIMFAFTLPTVILYTIFFLVTMLIGVYYSFTDWNGISKDYTFVGLKNYVKVLTDERFREALWFNIGYTIALVVLLIVIPLTIALALNRIRRLSTLFRSIYFIPAVISMVTVGLIWNELFYRAVPAIGEMLNIEALSTSPLGNPKLAAIAIMVVNIWQGCAIPTVLFIAGLQSVPKDLLEAATIDINYKTFQSILENAFYENSGECFILTGEQELFHIGEDLYQKEEKGYIFDKSQKMMKENLIVDTFQSKGKNFYISSRQNMLSGWKIIQVIPEERLFEEVDQKIKWNSIFLLGALMLVVSFSIYYTKKIIEPLEEFCKKISHTKGDQLQIINLEHMKLTREIANVIENYNEMANKMNEYLVREIIYDKNQRKMQSKMLRYQIDPHFLYNTLNLIASMGELSDFPEIVEITKNLSCIMQYNVKGSRFVSLKTEVEMVKAYLEIQRIRFHDCFSVEYEIERQILL